MTSHVRELGSELIAALLRVLDRIAGGFTKACAMLGIAVPTGLAACQGSDVRSAPQPAVRELVTVEQPPAPPDKELGEFHMTMYFVVNEDEAELIERKKKQAKAAKKAAAKVAASAGAADDADADDDDADADDVIAAGDDTVLANAPEPVAPQKELVTLYNGKDCSVIADVSPEFADQAELQGTGKLRDGRVINVWGHCKCGRTRAHRCYTVTGRKWGNAGNGRPLDPFRTVAVDPKVVKLGSLLYLPALDGMTMPGRAPIGGFKHDGCVAADDTGGGIDGKQLDLFVGRRSFYLGLAQRKGSHRWAKNIKVLDGKSRCERKGGRVYRVGAPAI
jgi:3D (Asp-Asp-Asp) domain-containing protein